MDAILEYLLTYWPAVALMLVLLALGVTWTRKFTKWEDNHDHTLSRLADAQDRLNNNVAGVTARLDGVEKDMTVIKTLLGAKVKGLSDILSNKQSPRHLNDNGRKVFDDIGGEKFLADNRDFLFSKIDELKPKTALDVEIAAGRVCNENTDNDIFNRLKNYVYNAPYLELAIPNTDATWQHDLTMEDVCFVLSLPLRDMYLAEHPELLQP